MTRPLTPAELNLMFEALDNAELAREERDMRTSDRTGSESDPGHHHDDADRLTERLTEQQLTDIDEHLDAYRRHAPTGIACCSAHPVADAVPVLLAEIRRLRTELATRSTDLNRAALDAVRYADDVARLRTVLDGYRCLDCGGEGGSGTEAPDVWAECQTCRGTGRTADRAAVLAEVVAWLTKKAGECQNRTVADAIVTLASKVHRGAVRPDNLLGAGLSLIESHTPVDRAAVLREAADRLQQDTLLHDDCACGDLLRRMADETAATETCPTPETHNWGCGCPSDEDPAALGTLPAWLYQRFMAHGVGWGQLDEDDRSYWEHQARAVRRAVARGGFKQPAACDEAH